jgi:hypothetical protein
VIEWLGEEQKTGQLLAERIKNGDGIRVRLHLCKSAGDVLAALQWAADFAASDGQIPVVHIEAHGIPPGGVTQTSPGLIGPDGHGGEEELAWSVIAPYLRQLNLLTDFRLMVVGAACYSLASLNMFELSKMAPFALIVGFDSPVDSGRLLKAMREFYRTMFGSNPDVPQSLINARAELWQGEGERLQGTVFHWFATSMVERLVYDEFAPAHRASHTLHLARCFLECGKALSLTEVEVHYAKTVRDHVNKLVAVWFAYDVLPDNRRRFPLDVARIMD